MWDNVFFDNSNTRHGWTVRLPSPCWLNRVTAVTLLTGPAAVTLLAEPCDCRHSAG